LYFTLGRVAADLGAVFHWSSLEDGAPIKVHLGSQNLHPAFPPIVETEDSSRVFTMMQGPTVKADEIPVSHPLVGQDLVAFTALLAIFPDLNQKLTDGALIAATTASPVPSPFSKNFFRVKRVYFDADTDGLFDHVELAGGTNPYDWDSDGDGIPDGSDPFPLINDARENPHTAGLPAGLTNDLVGIWDFETAVTTAGRTQFPPAIPGVGSPCEVLLGGKWAPTEGVVSHGFDMKEDFTSLEMDGGMLGDTDEFTMILSVKMAAGELDARSQPMDLLGFGGAKAGASRFGAIPSFHAQITTAGKIRLSYDRYLAWNSTDSTEDWFVEWPAPDSLDDGKWHQLAMTRKTKSNGLFEYRVYLDGALIGVPKDGSVIPTILNSHRFFVMGSKSNSSFNGLATFKGLLDRVRIYDNDLSQVNIQALYNQDADLHGLYDRVEGRSLKWFDKNGNDVLEIGETFFQANPFRWDPEFADHDQDGLGSLDEQNTIHTDPVNPDSDGDLLLDGWEHNAGLDPLDAAGIHGTQGDFDDDGVSNLIEFNFQSNPAGGDSDSDGRPDFVEIFGADADLATPDGSNPNESEVDGDGNDLAGDLYAILVGVGDQSDSESEDYIVKVFEIDPETGFESAQPMLIHRAGGIGEYSERPYRVFRRNRAYTFQIRWQKTAQPYNKPDFDYTFKVEPLPTGSDAPEVFDSLSDSGGGYIESDLKLLGQVDSDSIDNFRYEQEEKRVGVMNLYLGLWVDSNMNGRAELGLKEKFNGSRADELAEEDERSVIIDVNNNNTNEDGEIDNRNEVLDGEEDRSEHTKRIQEDGSSSGSGTAGHRFGTVMISIPFHPRLSEDEEYQLKTKFGNPESENIIRLFDFPNYEVKSDGEIVPEMILGPGHAETTIDKLRFFEAADSKFGKMVQREYFAEGLTYGYALIGAQIVDENGAIKKEDIVRMTVNVDRVEQPPGDVAELDARLTRGQFPHHVGVSEEVGTLNLIAIRGRLKCRVPTIGTVIGGSTEWHTRHTWMDSHPLRQNREQDAQSSGSSFWIGFQQTGNSFPSEHGTAVGANTLNNLRWVQFGVRWKQLQHTRYGLEPAAYLEIGDKLFDAKSIRHAISGSSLVNYGGGIGEKDKSSMTGWEQGPWFLTLFSSGNLDPKAWSGTKVMR